MSRTTLFLLQRITAFLDGYKYGTRGADWSPLVRLIEEIIRWLG